MENLYERWESLTLSNQTAESSDHPDYDTRLKLLYWAKPGAAACESSGTLEGSLADQLNLFM